MTESRSKLWLAANGLMLLMFAFSAVVQVNDPDPLPWTLVYAAAAAVCAMEMRRKTPWWAACAIGVVAIVWAATIGPRVIGVVPFGSMFAEFEMRDRGVEESREMYGLILVGIWMLAIELAALRRRRSAHRT